LLFQINNKEDYFDISHYNMFTYDF